MSNTPVFHERTPRGRRGSSRRSGCPKGNGARRGGEALKRGLWGVIGLMAGLGLMAGVRGGDPVPVRIVAANLTSGNHQTYSPDNANHSNPEGAGARILKGLKPDIALVQEFNTSVPVRQWVNATFGPEFAVFVEEEPRGGIPNGIVSRWPIVESGEWEDGRVPNRDFAWARIALPNGRSLWAVSVHWYSQKADVRAAQAEAVREFVRTRIPAEDLVVLGGDFNTRDRGEAAVRTLADDFDVTADPPTDQAGDPDTNGPRSRPYDWVAADAELRACAAPTKIGPTPLEDGLVFDSRVFEPLSAVAPVQRTDSAAPQMQHMAVVRDFIVPAR